MPTILSLNTFCNFVPARFCISCLSEPNWMYVSPWVRSRTTKLSIASYLCRLSEGISIYSAMGDAASKSKRWEEEKWGEKFSWDWNSQRKPHYKMSGPPKSLSDFRNDNPTMWIHRCSQSTENSRDNWWNKNCRKVGHLEGLNLLDMHPDNTNRVRAAGWEELCWKHALRYICTNPPQTLFNNGIGTQFQPFFQLGANLYLGRSLRILISKVGHEGHRTKPKS